MSTATGWERPKFRLDAELRYAAYSRCRCGAGLAYAPDDVRGIHGAWDCSAILTGRAIPKDSPGWVTHDEPSPFAFYEIKSEDQPSARGQTTRPPEDAVARARRVAFSLQAAIATAVNAYNRNAEQKRAAEEQEAPLRAALDAAFAARDAFEARNQGVLTIINENGVARWADFTPEPETAA